MKKLFPLLVFVFALAGGLAVGLILKPAAPEPEACDPEAVGCEEYAEAAQDEKKAAPKAELPPGSTDFAKLNKQFVVPVVRGERVQALVVASIALEVDQGLSETVFQVEPKLQDVFLRVLFTHAHSGGFDGEFTAEYALDDLRERLNEEASAILGDILHEVLITEIVRQDL